MSRRVYFAVFGSGLGHVTRVLEVARKLEGAGHEFRFSSSGQGLEFLRSAGVSQKVVESPFLDVEWVEGAGFSSWHVLPNFPFTFNKFLKQLAFEGASIPSFDPKVVVSDSRLSAVMAAKRTGYPVVTMLNQFSVAFPPRFRSPLGRFYERVAGDCLGLMWSLSDHVLMTDLPPPYTIGEANLVGADVAGVVEYVGFTAPRVNPPKDAVEKAKKRLDLDRRPLVFCQISGPDATKGRFTDTLMSAADEVCRDHNLVISLGYPGGSQTPRRLASGAWVFDWCPVKDELFALADVLVGRAGHSTIGQCIDLGKPAVLVPIHNHPEQIGNAEKFARLGLGLDIRAEKLTPSSFVEGVSRLLGDSAYGQRMAEVSAVSQKYDGVQRTADIVRAYD